MQVHTGRRYTLFAHAPNFPDIPVIPWHSRKLSVFELPECRENLASLYVSVKSEGLGTRLGLAVLIQPRNKFALPTGTYIHTYIHESEGGSCKASAYQRHPEQHTFQRKMSCPGWDSNARHSAITYMCFCCSTVHVFRDIDLSILQCAILYTTVIVY